MIQSKDNLLIKEIKKLKEKRYRVDEQKFLVEGFRFVLEAFSSTFEVEYVFVNEEQLDKYESFDVEKHIQKNTKVYLVKDVAFKAICSTETPQGIVAVVRNKSVEPQDRKGVYVLADKVQDPGNMGTIIRTAHAAGAIGVIVTKGTVDLYNEKTLRSTMGSIFNIPIIEAKELDVIKELKEKGFKVIVSSLQDSKNFYDVDLRDKVIIVVGNEGNGVSEEVFDLSDIRVKIPMPGNAESLNVGVAASIMLFEAVRQNI